MKTHVFEIAETKLIEAKLNEIIQLLLDSSTCVEQEILNTQQAAKYLGISSRTLFNYCKQGRINFAQPSRKYFFRKEDLNNFITNPENY